MGWSCLNMVMMLVEVVVVVMMVTHEEMRKMIGIEEGL